VHALLLKSTEDIFPIEELWIGKYLLIIFIRMFGIVYVTWM
jgi:hypothetical protein